jgi:hypothetical protein
VSNLDLIPARWSEVPSRGMPLTAVDETVIDGYMVPLSLSQTQAS